MAGKKPAPKPKKSAPAAARKSAKPVHAPARKHTAAPAPSKKSSAKAAVKPAAVAAASSSKPSSKGPVKPVSVPVLKPLPKVADKLANKSAEKTSDKPAEKTIAAKPVSKGVIAIATMKSPPPVAVVPGDDSDGGEPSSLLAGPRNVKPYIAKRGERYMSKEQLGHFQTILQSWKRDLMVEVDRTVSHMKDEAANFPDPNDRATQEEEFSLELRTRDRERKLIRKIDEALKRVEDGNYGYCLETGEEIGIKRLEARPVATLTIEAQERRERRERQYGDRDDRYR
jgi:DnaK suppressor protein